MPSHRMSPLLLLAVFGVVAAMPPVSARAAEPTVIDQLIAAQNPCSGLKASAGSVSIGLDELENVALEQADVSLRGDDISVSLAGSFACHSASGAAFERGCHRTVVARGLFDQEFGGPSARLRRHLRCRA